MGRKYQAYPEYNDSAEWIGNIPSHWSLVPLKRVCSLITGLTPSTQTQSYYTDEDGKPWVRPEDLHEGVETVQASKYVSDTGWNVVRIVPAHSTLICCIGTIGKVGYTDIEVSTNQQITSASFRDSSRYYYYLLMSARQVLEETATGNVIQILNSERLGGIPVLLLPANEAETIANFLDHETAKIDTLIEKQQQLIKLLKEKRQAVISHAVTKGLNPDAPMRDSGVEWLGEVPAHWVVGRYKFCTMRVVVGIAEAATHAYADSGVPIIRSTNIKEEGLDSADILFIKEEFAEQNESKYLYTNDVVTVRTGYPGISAVVPDELNKSQCFTNLIATPKKGCLPVFLAEYLNSHTGKSYFELLGWGSAQKNISVPILQNIPIAYPSEAEQQEIVQLAEAQRVAFAKLIHRAEALIRLLMERRTALISAAVTGKIDARDWEGGHA